MAMQPADPVESAARSHVPGAVASLRYWEPDDLAAELFFMDQRGEGHSVKMAGTIATRLRRAMRDQPEANQLALVTLENGNRFALPASTLDLSTGWNSGAAIREALIVDTRNLRARIQRLIEADHKINGRVNEEA